MSFSRRTNHRETAAPSPRVQELREQIQQASAVSAMAQTQGWKVLQGKMQLRRIELLNELVAAKVLTDVPMLQAQLRMLDEMLKIVPEEIERGEFARNEIEKTLEVNNG